MMDPISAAVAIAQLINTGLTMVARAQGKSPDPEISQLIEAGARVLTQAQQISGLLVKAHQEGRDITQAELDAVVAGDDDARATLAAAIAAAGGSARPDRP